MYSIKFLLHFIKNIYNYFDNNNIYAMFDITKGNNTPEQ